MKFKLSLLLLIAALVFSCQTDTAESLDKEAVENHIKALMQEQQECWNAGDIPCFMKHYWQSPELMFIGKSGVTYGWQQTLDNYNKSYPSPEAMGQLTFDFVKVEVVSAESTFVVGKWHLDRSEDELGGHFTLLWKKLDSGDWVIVADHSS